MQWTFEMSEDWEEITSLTYIQKQKATHKDFLLVRQEGNRSVNK